MNTHSVTAIGYKKYYLHKINGLHAIYKKQSHDTVTVKLIAQNSR